uniref:EB domain-containing protein n=1 Tax=Rhabditophanes sp. KR3021 TaxID=114890 RepID=A0AC35TGE4_9BILA
MQFLIILPFMVALGNAAIVGTFQDCSVDGCGPTDTCTKNFQMCVKRCSGDSDCNGSTCSKVGSNGKYCVSADAPACFLDAHCRATLICSPFTANCQPFSFSNNAKIGESCGPGNNKCGANLVCNPTLLFHLDDDKTFTCTKGCKANSSDCNHGSGEFSCHTCGYDAAIPTRAASYCEVNFTKRCLTDEDCTGVYNGSKVCNQQTLQCVPPPAFCF